MDLMGHRALITGAGQGIGKACAMVFARRGTELVLMDRNVDTLQAVAERLQEMGRSVITCAVDLADFDRVEAELETLHPMGPIDILVNNAGFDRPGTTERISREGFEAVLGIHLTAPLLLIKRLLPAMRSAGWGRIVNVGSIYGRIGGKGEVAYSTAKAGVIGLTKSVAREAGRDGVTVNAVLPGITRTPTIENFMAERFKEKIIAETPLGRMAEAEEVANVIAFLASEDASYVTGVELPVSGGWGI